MVFNYFFDNADFENWFRWSYHPATKCSTIYENVWQTFFGWRFIGRYHFRVVCGNFDTARNYNGSLYMNNMNKPWKISHLYQKILMHDKWLSWVTQGQILNIEKYHWRLMLVRKSLAELIRSQKYWTVTLFFVMLNLVLVTLMKKIFMTRSNLWCFRTSKKTSPISFWRIEEIRIISCGNFFNY